MKYPAHGLIILSTLLMNFAYAVATTPRVRDSLVRGEQYRTLSFQELLRLETGLEVIGDTSGLKEVLSWHLYKARKEKDTFELLETYKWLSWLEDYRRGIQLLDTAIHINKKYSEKHRYSAILQYRKGIKHYYADSPVPCFKSLLIALEHSRELGDTELFVKCLNLIAVLKMEYGQELEALRLQQSSLDILLKNKDKMSDFDLMYVRTLDGLAIGYLHAGSYDSARVVARKGLEFCHDKDYADFDRNFRLLLAQVNYYDGNFLKARDTLLEIQDQFSGKARADILYYLGMIYGKFGNNERKRAYFKQVDSILSSADLPYLDSAEKIYEFLLREAVAMNLPGEQERYLERSRYFDSLVQLHKLQVQSISHARFDRIMHELVYHPRERSSSRGTLTVISLLTLAAAGLYSILRFRNSRRMIEVSEEMQKEISETGLESKIEQKILTALKEWEQNDGFLDMEVKLSTLALRLGTNSAYLSKVINVHKGVSFANYLKDLRIKNALEYIHRHREEASKMSTIQLAEKFGFKSQDVFVKTLKLKTGYTPSKYLKQLR